MDNKSIYEALAAVQAELKAPKGQTNTFGGYKYRSCEDILEAVKPILKANRLAMQLFDEPMMVGDWHYIKATALVTDFTGQQVSCSAYAREPEQKTKMDAAQVTGTSSSYARKYALNGLFCIDDTKDPDTDEYQKQNEPPRRPAAKQPTRKSAPPPPPVCACCGKPVEAVEYKGRTVTPAETAASTQKKFGRVLCWTCAQKQPKEDGGMTHA